MELSLQNERIQTDLVSARYPAGHSGTTPDVVTVQPLAEGAISCFPYRARSGDLKKQLGK